MRGKIEGLSDYDAWRITNAIVRHFKGNYDAVKYHFKMKSLSPSAFEKCRGRYLFAKLADRFKTEEALIKYVVANAKAGNTWPTQMNDGELSKMTTLLQSFGYQFREDLSYLQKQDPKFDNWLRPQDGNKSPKIIGELLSDSINIETVVVLDAITGFLVRGNRVIDDPLIWDETFTLTQNYRPFLVKWVNLGTAKNTVLKVFTS